LIISGVGVSKNLVFKFSKILDFDPQTKDPAAHLGKVTGFNSIKLNNYV
jgi:hypothetical protein